MYGELIVYGLLRDDYSVTHTHIIIGFDIDHTQCQTPVKIVSILSGRLQTPRFYSLLVAFYNVKHLATFKIPVMTFSVLYPLGTDEWALTVGKLREI